MMNRSGRQLFLISKPKAICNPSSLSPFSELLMSLLTLLLSIALLLRQLYLWIYSVKVAID